jgi:phage baseplate assembly protein W
MSTYRGFSTYNRFKKFRLTDFELAKQDLFNIFNIRKGEKLMNPGFGTIIWDVLFDPFTSETKQQIVDDIKRIAQYDPRLALAEVTVTQYEYGIQLALELTYIPTNQTEQMFISFNQGTNSATRSN